MRVIVKFSDLTRGKQAEIMQDIREYLVEFRHLEIEEYMAENADPNPDNPDRAGVDFENAVAVLSGKMTDKMEFVEDEYRGGE